MMLQLVVIFDADMVCYKDFYTKILAELYDPQVAIVLTPQKFHNYNMKCDIFNHSNLIYWQVSLPGLDGWDNISCTGTNFVIRARAAQEVGISLSPSLQSPFPSSATRLCARRLKGEDQVHTNSVRICFLKLTRSAGSRTRAHEMKSSPSKHRGGREIKCTGALSVRNCLILSAFAGRVRHRHMFENAAAVGQTRNASGYA